MFQATKYFESIDFWGHCGVWGDWPKYLVDGVHFTQEGNRKYYNFVLGAVSAAANKLTCGAFLIGELHMPVW